MSQNRKTIFAKMFPPGVPDQLVTLLTGDFRRSASVVVVATTDVPINIKEHASFNSLVWRYGQCCKQQRNVTSLLMSLPREVVFFFLFCF